MEKKKAFCEKEYLEHKGGYSTEQLQALGSIPRETRDYVVGFCTLCGGVFLKSRLNKIPAQSSDGYCDDICCDNCLTKRGT